VVIQISLSAKDKSDDDPLRVSNFTMLVRILPTSLQESNEGNGTFVPDESEGAVQGTSTTESRLGVVISEAEKLRKFIVERD